MTKVRGGGLEQNIIEEKLPDPDREALIVRLQTEPTEQHLWDAVVACQKLPFWTYSGLPFTYELHRGRDGSYTKELWIDRRENSKSLAWSSVLLAFAGVRNGKITVKRPKELGDIRGISYIYALFLRFGLIEAAVRVDGTEKRQRRTKK